jgi:hypothetical protein
VLLSGVLVLTAPPQAASKGTATMAVPARSPRATTARRLMEADWIAIAVLSGVSNATGITQPYRREGVALGQTGVG